MQDNRTERKKITTSQENLDVGKKYKHTPPHSQAYFSPGTLPPEGKRSLFLEPGSNDNFRGWLAMKKLPRYNPLVFMETKLLLGSLDYKTCSKDENIQFPESQDY